MPIALIGAAAEASRPADAAVLQQRARHHAARAGAQRTRAARQVRKVWEERGGEVVYAAAMGRSVGEIGEDAGVCSSGDNVGALGAPRVQTGAESVGKV